MSSLSGAAGWLSRIGPRGLAALNAAAALGSARMSGGRGKRATAPAGWGGSGKRAIAPAGRTGSSVSTLSAGFCAWRGDGAVPSADCISRAPDVSVSCAADGGVGNGVDGARCAVTGGSISPIDSAVGATSGSQGVTARLSEGAERNGGDDACTSSETRGGGGAGRSTAEDNVSSSSGGLWLAAARPAGANIDPNIGRMARPGRSALSAMRCK